MSSEAEHAFSLGDTTSSQPIFLGPTPTVIPVADQHKWGCEERYPDKEEYPSSSWMPYQCTGTNHMQCLGLERGGACAGLCYPSGQPPGVMLRTYETAQGVYSKTGSCGGFPLPKLGAEVIDQDASHVEDLPQVLSCASGMVQKIEDYFFCHGTNNYCDWAKTKVESIQGDFVILRKKEKKCRDLIDMCNRGEKNVSLMGVEHTLDCSGVVPTTPTPTPTPTADPCASKNSFSLAGDQCTPTPGPTPKPWKKWGKEWTPEIRKRTPEEDKILAEAAATAKKAVDYARQQIDNFGNLSKGDRKALQEALKEMFGSGANKKELSKKLQDISKDLQNVADKVFVDTNMPTVLSDGTPSGAIRNKETGAIHLPNDYFDNRKKTLDWDGSIPGDLVHELAHAKGAEDQFYCWEDAGTCGVVRTLIRDVPQPPTPITTKQKSKAQKNASSIENFVEAMAAKAPNPNP